MTSPDAPGGSDTRDGRIEASQIKGRAVLDAEGQLIGTIQDLVVALADGRIVEVVVWFHQRAGGEASYHLLPWASLRIAPDGNAFVADPSGAVRLEE